MVRRRAWLVAFVVGASAVAATGGETAAGGGGAARSESTAVTVRGVLEEFVIDRVGDAHTRYAVRGADGSWWLDGLPEPTPAAGSTVAVTGAPGAGNTLHVATLRVTAPPTGELTVAARARSTKVLLLRVYWGSRPPAKPTAATAKRKAITKPRAWFREVSHGRYTVSGGVTPWLRVPRPKDCVNDAFKISNQALAVARRKGIRLERYGRFMYYLPCNGGGLLGFGSKPGNQVWLFNTLDLQVLVHEQGHNLGLHHASARLCTSRAWETVTWSSSCEVDEYGDEIDTMGNRRPGHFSALAKSQLGWLQRATTVTATRTVDLAPYETTGPGVKAIKLRAGRSTYWLEYRTRRGSDRSMPAGTHGVQIRIPGPEGRTQVLDAGPGSTVNHYDSADVHLPAGSSWTTPQKVRITVTRQTSSVATVAIRFGAGAAKAPSTPTAVRARAGVNAARITWTRPADNGSIIRGYRITRSDGPTRTVTSFAGATTAYTWSGLDPNRTYRFSVRALNEAGASGAATSAAVRPLLDTPSAAITGPAQGATVAGVVPITFTAAPNASTRVPILYASLSIDNVEVHYDYGAPWEPFRWDTRRDVPNGSHTITLTVADQAGKTVTITRRVTVANPARAVTITAPTDGATVGPGDVDVMYQLAPATWDWQWVELLVDGVATWTETPGTPLVLPSWIAPGQHSLQVRAHDGGSESYVSAPIEVTVVG
jgi:hypothetical protein